ncbi:DUF3782 domain-containing protein [Thiocystis violacea]|uniref:DUF3782 domain-containing protein n=1 Tax=Thiocystis violacea TaxID=13725 RepID=UPI001906C5D9|nr:DUF3782 domain-containing protein [Thiocystis violacea]MBK1717659.1 DUF3782 domain-containing protein [Thiocystis violacea]
MAATADEVWDLLRELIAAQKETDRKFQETDRKFQESARLWREESEESARRWSEERQKTERLFREERQLTEREQRKTDRQLKELGKQIGGLGEKFGSFTEGLALPSMEKLLRERFGMEVVSPSVRVSKAGRHLEIDVLSYANGDLKAVYLVEVKSHLREEAIAQMKTLLEQFRVFFPEHRDKRLFGILAAVDLSAAMRERALREGFYVARIHDQVFELDVPDDFQPRVF